MRKFFKKDFIFFITASIYLIYVVFFPKQAYIFLVYFLFFILLEIRTKNKKTELRKKYIDLLIKNNDSLKNTIELVNEEVPEQYIIKIKERLIHNAKIIQINFKNK